MLGPGVILSRVSIVTHGTGTIVARMVENNRVEEIREKSEFPPIKAAEFWNFDLSVGVGTAEYSYVYLLVHIVQSRHNRHGLKSVLKGQGDRGVCQHTGQKHLAPTSI